MEVSALADREEWVVTLRDNGVGVEPEHAGRIFGMFSRVNGETEGTGIGLPPRRRCARRAHLGRASAGRRQRLPVHAAALTTRSSVSLDSRDVVGRGRPGPDRAWLLGSEDRLTVV